MVKKELISLFEKNVLLFAKLSEKINRDQIHFGGYSKQQMQFLVRLYIGGRQRLKDKAAREFIPAPNLCTMFKKLERDGLVSREIDENDRRNTWYSVTDAGAGLARDVIATLHVAMGVIFQGLSKQDEEDLISAFNSINKIFSKLEAPNA